MTYKLKDSLLFFLFFFSSLFLYSLVFCFVFEVWKMTSSNDLMAVLAGTSVHSCLWLLLSGKDRQTLTVWHGLDTLEICIFPFSKTKVRRRDNNHEIIKVKKVVS